MLCIWSTLKLKESRERRRSLLCRSIPLSLIFLRVSSPPPATPVLPDRLHSTVLKTELYKLFTVLCPVYRDVHRVTFSQHKSLPSQPCLILHSTACQAVCTLTGLISTLELRTKLHNSALIKVHLQFTKP